MSVLILLILVSLAVALAFLLGFFWSVRSGQYEDSHTPALRILFDDKNNKTEENKSLNKPKQK